MSLALAAGYVASLTAVYYVFVRWYRASKAKALRAEAAPEPWFPDGHPTRTAYEELYASLPDELGSGDVAKLKRALLARCVTNVHRVFALREDRQCLAALLRDGAIGDDLWAEFTAAENDINAEVQVCVREAEHLEKGWGNSIFQQAAQVVAQQAQREAEEKRKQHELQQMQMRAMAEASRREQQQREQDEQDEQQVERELAARAKQQGRRRSSGAKSGKGGGAK